MKYGLLFALFAITLCRDAQVLGVEKDFPEIMRCLAEHAAPLRAEVMELINAWKEKEYLKCLELIPKILALAKEIEKICLEEITLGSIKSIAKCIFNYLKEHPEEIIGKVKDLYNAIKKKNWVKAAELIFELGKKGYKIVKECM